MLLTVTRSVISMLFVFKCHSTSVSSSFITTFAIIAIEEFYMIDFIIFFISSYSKILTLVDFRRGTDTKTKPGT